MPDFHGASKVEINQLKDDLESNDTEKIKVAAKRVVALMRDGENVQSLFASMIRSVHTQDIELKKLIYLYIIAYSVKESEQAIMCVSALIKDAKDQNPLVRALAIRTMCRIRLENIAENLILPLKQSLIDVNPYVRKTAAMGVCKLYDVIPDSIENSDLFKDLLELLNDDNPLVVSNTISAICEINEHRTKPIFTLTEKTVVPILNAISSSGEWCQINLFDILATYTPSNEDDRKFLFERLVPFLRHSNPAVVIGAFKCLFHISNPSEYKTILPPFLALVNSAAPEIQYCILRTLSLFVQKNPKALAKEIRLFFCKYNDPSYVKMEKVQIAVTICTPQTAQTVLDEFSEYCNEVDVGFVRKTIFAIGSIALKIEAAARRCVDILISQIKGKADYACESAIIVSCNILRKYPRVFDSIVSIICDSLDRVKDPDAKAAAIWAIGEYCKQIESVDIILDSFIDGFHDELPNVQIQILTALVKCYVEKPEETKDQLQYVLNEATSENSQPDVRNRAILYWRLLSVEPQNARNYVIFPKDSLFDGTSKYDDAVLDTLIQNMGRVSGVLHTVPSDFVRKIYTEDDNRNYILAKSEDYCDIYLDMAKECIWIKVVPKDQLSGFAFALNKNPLGLTVGEIQVPNNMEPGQEYEIPIPITVNKQEASNFDSNELQMAMKTDHGVIYTAVSLAAAQILI